MPSATIWPALVSASTLRRWAASSASGSNGFGVLEVLLAMTFSLISGEGCHSTAIATARTRPWAERGGFPFSQNGECPGRRRCGAALPKGSGVGIGGMTRSDLIKRLAAANPHLYTRDLERIV